MRPRHPTTTFPDATEPEPRAPCKASATVKGNGRVYRASYTVTGKFGIACSGIVKVGVLVRKGGAVIDDGDQSSWSSFTGALVQ